MDLEEKLKAMTPAQRALLMERLAQRQVAREPELNSLPHADLAKDYPLSHEQQRIWFMSQFDPASPEYNIPIVYAVTGELDTSLLTQAVVTTLEFHPILRSYYYEVEGVARQAIETISDFASRKRHSILPQIDFTERDEQLARSDALREIKEDSHTAFDLQKDGVFRSRLFKISNEKYLWYINVHHIAFDAWSHSLLVQQIFQCYKQLQNGENTTNITDYSYVDYACWQRSAEQEKKLQGKLVYWKNKLADVPPLELYTDRPRPSERTYNGNSIAISLPAKTTAALRTLCHEIGVTPFTLMLTALRVLLHKYSRQEDFAIGTLIANRSRTELENVIGFFTNTLAFRTFIDSNLTFTEQLQQEKQTVFEAFANQDISFEKLVEELNPTRDMSRAAIFQVMLILNNTHSATTSSAPQAAALNNTLQLKALTTENQTSKYDLTFYFNEGNELTGFIEYNTDLFNRDSIGRMAQHLTLLLERVLHDPHKSIASTSLLSLEEENQILQHWSRGPMLETTAKTVDQLVKLQAQTTPKTTAIISRGCETTYEQLASRSEKLAEVLTRAGVKRGSYVAIATERNTSMIVAMLGVLKAGAAYVPVDLSYPADRVQYMLSTSKVSAVISQHALSVTLPTGEWQTILLADDGTLQSISLAKPEALSREEPQTSDHAYVIFTSGSTGLPKGVLIRHDTVVNFLQAMSQAPGMQAGEKLLAVTTISFDIAVLEIFLPLINGGTVVLADKDQLQDANCILNLIQQHDINIMQATPSTWRMLLDMGWSGKRNMRILCGGEALPPELSETLLLRSSSFWNLYGPTEATVWCSRHRIESGDGENGAVTIGKPIENIQIYLLDEHQHPVPVGVPGEIFIGGSCLSSGYMERPDLTNESFIENSALGAGLFYRTRDLARYNSEGNIIFLGRADSQVKVRGFRIELGEIDTTLNKHRDIQQAVSVVHEIKPGDKRIVCYFEAHEPRLDQEKLRLYLKKHIPEYMIPSIFIQLTKLPLTPNGKINRRALPKPSSDLIQSGVPYVAPTTDIEATLCRLYQQILRVEQVGIDDDFFSLGGDSLLVIQLVSKAKLFDICLTPRQVFQHKNVRLLAEASATTQILRQLEPVVGIVGMTPAQKHFLSLHHTHPNYHTLGVYLEPRDHDFDIQAIEKSLQQILLRHDSLRMRLADVEDQISLICDPPVDTVPLHHVTLTTDSREEHEKQLGKHIYHTVTALDLHNGPLFQAYLYQSNLDIKPMLFMFGHFMLADIGSWHIIIDDFETCYRQFSRNEPLQLTEKATSFKQWVEKLTVWGRSEEMNNQRRYWLLPERKYAAVLPKDFPDGLNLMSTSQSVYVHLDKRQTTILLDEVPKVTGAKIDAILLTSIVYAFKQSCNSNSLMIDLLGHGKEALFDDVDLSRTVGWFNTIYPAFLNYGDNPNPVAAVKAINEQLRAIPNGGIGYGVLRYLNKDKELIAHFDNTPEPQVFFNYFGHDNQADLRVLHKVDGFGGYGLDHQTKRLRPLAVGVYIKNGCMSVRWEFSNAIYREERIEKLGEDCRQCILEIIKNYNNL